MENTDSRGSLGEQLTDYKPFITFGQWFKTCPFDPWPLPTKSSSQPVASAAYLTVTSSILFTASSIAVSAIGQSASDTDIIDYTETNTALYLLVGALISQAVSRFVLGGAFAQGVIGADYKKMMTTSSIGRLAYCFMLPLLMTASFSSAIGLAIFSSSKSGHEISIGLISAVLTTVAQGLGLYFCNDSGLRKNEFNKYEHVFSFVGMWDTRNQTDSQSTEETQQKFQEVERLDDQGNSREDVERENVTWCGWGK